MAHQPVRGSDVEAWIRAAREKQPPQGNAWRALDDLLSDYRDHADTGTPLDRQAICGTCAGRGCPDCPEYAGRQVTTVNLPD